MEVGNTRLMEAILEFDRRLGRGMRIIAVGGTALTLLGKKESTKDIDLCFENEGDKERFAGVAGRMGYSRESGRLAGHGLIIDIYSGGYIFCVQLPPDYAERAVEIRDMGRIHLFSLAPEDLVITKTARLSQRDMEDIRAIFGAFDIDREALVSRYMAAMEKSVVKDAKLNLLAVADAFGFPAGLRKRIGAWEYGGV